VADDVASTTSKGQGDGRDGVEYKMSGEEDAWAEDVHVVQYDAANKICNDIGPLNTSFRSS
jgi:hypothetical protein